MSGWTAIVLTCTSQDSSFVYQKELELRQEKGLIDKECLVLCIEDPESPIGSGGATLNALYIVAEALSAKNNLTMTVYEVLKESYILIMHTGRNYPFDMTGKAFTSLPLQDENFNMLTNFDLCYNMQTNKIAGFSKDSPSHSDPGIYICSTDILFMASDTEKICIRNSPICVISSLGNIETVQKNGIYELANNKEFVENIYYQPNNKVLEEIERTNDKYNLIGGFVYLNHEVAENLFNLLLCAPIEGCSTSGIDNGATPLSLSLFFDILLAACNGIEKEDYIYGSFKSNIVANNEKAVLQQARLILWNMFQSKKYQIRNITIDKADFFYLDNVSLQHRFEIFEYFEKSDLVNLFNLSNSELPDNLFLVNSFIDNSKCLKSNDLKKKSFILNCQFTSCEIEIGSNCILNDLKLEKISKLKIPSEIFIQNIHLNNDITVNVVLGTRDELDKVFNQEEWNIMNMKWQSFSYLTDIFESDLWGQDIKENERNIFNAKLYPISSIYLDDQEMGNLRNFFWIDLINSLDSKNLELVTKWRTSMRLSLQDIIKTQKMQNLFDHRRKVLNKIHTDIFIKHLKHSKSIYFNSIIIQMAIHDGFANNLLEQLDNLAQENYQNLFVIPRIMNFISKILSELSKEFRLLRNGPTLNSKWSCAYEDIQNKKNKEALIKLSKIRKSWMNRNDLLIRASRHYEGAMLAFIRQATSDFKKRIEFDNPIMKPINKPFNWVEVNCPARLDLAGGWSDTPPVTYEYGGSVTNVAILVNGIKPIGSRARILKSDFNESCLIRVIMQESKYTTKVSEKTIFEFNELKELSDYNKPKAVACLMKAVFIYTKLVELNDKTSTLSDQLKAKLNGSLELYTWTGLPHGSGLGTSSILICCVLKAVWSLMGITVPNEDLIYSVLVVEQLMTTNGGWQDQVGGIFGGFKVTTSKKSLPIELDIKKIELNSKFLDSINSRLILIYTGLTRLAKDLLLNVLRNWYNNSTKIYNNVHDLVKNSEKCTEALKNENLMLLGECISNYRRGKLVMAPGSEPEKVQKLIIKLEPFVHGMALAGAGGGGFFYVLTKEADCKKEIQKIIDESNFEMKIYDCQVSNDGIDTFFT